jgi:hypothetical protein
VGAVGCAALVMSCSYDYSALNGRVDASAPAPGGTGGASGAPGGGVLNIEAGGADGGVASSSGSGGGPLVDGGGLAIDGPGDDGPGIETGGGLGSGGGLGTGGGLASSTGGDASGLGGDVPPSSSGGFGPGGAPGTGGTAASGSGGGGGVAGSGGAAASGGASGGATDPDLVLWYTFDESSGNLAADASGAAGGPRNAPIVTTGLGGKAAFSTLHQVGTHSISLTGNGILGGGVVMLPSIDTLAPTAVTLAVWIYEASDVDWQRVFDFGSGFAGPQMFLTPREDKDSKHLVRFVITLLGSSTASEQIIQSAQAISLNAWHHLAITLQSGSPYKGTLYVDGVASGTNAAMTLHPADLGFAIQSYMGKSQFPTDPYLTGNIDDFRVYRRALSAAEIAALYAVR